MSDEMNPTASVETPEAPNEDAVTTVPAEAVEETMAAEPVAGIAEPVVDEEPAPVEDAPAAQAIAEVPADIVDELPVAADDVPVAQVVAEAPADIVDELPVAVDDVPVAQAVAETPAAVEASVPETTAVEAPTEPAPVLATPKSMDELTAGMELAGKVKRIELFGAFVDIGVGKDGLLHISQLGTPDVRNVEDVVQTGQSLVVYVLKVDKEQGRIALSLTKPVGISWEALRQGMEVTGTVIKLETYGVFVDFGAERPGMVHVSELASGYVKSPADVVKVGDVVTAQVIKLDKRKKRIDLSVKAMTEKEEVVSRQEMRDEPQEALPTAMELALRRAMDTEGGFDRSKRDRDRDDRRSRKYERDREDIYERTLRNHRG